MTTYWMFCVWVNALENPESLRFHAELPFDPRTLGPEQGGAFVAETMARLGVRPEQVGNLRDTPCMKMEIFDTEGSAPSATPRFAVSSTSRRTDAISGSSSDATGSVDR